MVMYVYFLKLSKFFTHAKILLHLGTNTKNIIVVELSVNISYRLIKQIVSKFEMIRCIYKHGEQMELTLTWIWKNQG